MEALPGESIPMLIFAFFLYFPFIPCKSSQVTSQIGLVLQRKEAPSDSYEFCFRDYQFSLVSKPRRVLKISTLNSFYFLSSPSICD